MPASPCTYRGIETIACFLSGSADHGDSRGNSGSITTGDVQWMPREGASSTRRMPHGDEKGRLHGFLLCANLPAF